MNNFTSHSHHPSFSSSLLEEIYRSFDVDNSTTMKKNSTKINATYLDKDRFILDHWIDNLRRTGFSDEKSRRIVNHSSSTCSSDSSSGIGGFSSSDSESMSGFSSKPPPLKPIRTAAVTPEIKNFGEIPATNKKKKKKEENKNKLQRRALKLYGDLKKVNYKQPISPGGKLASFLNSLFNATALKKPKSSSSSSPSVSSFDGHKSWKRESSSPATVYRSCLSKTPSSAGRFERRSVRFLDDDRDHVTSVKNADVARFDSLRWSHEDDDEHRISMAKEILKKFHSEKELITVNIVGDHHNGRTFKNDENISDDDDDDVSCCSSDLFELENLLDIGVGGGYCEELPVFETTNLYR